MTHEEAVDLRAEGIPIDDIRSRDLSWNHICAELADNSLDAKARRIEIILGKRSVTVRDDGIGVKDTRALLIYGRHDPQQAVEKMQADLQAFVKTLEREGYQLQRGEDGKWSYAPAAPPATKPPGGEQ
jgi:hypothetical protein